MLKRTLCVLMAVLMILPIAVGIFDGAANAETMTVSAASNANTKTNHPKSVLLGDANRDGVISLDDAILTCRCSLGLLAEVDYQCDVNLDGEVSIKDVILIARQTLGFIEPIYTYELTYTPPEEGHVIFDEESEVYYVDNQLLLVAEEATPKQAIENLVGEYGGTVIGYLEATDDFEIGFSNTYTLSELNGIAAALSNSALVLEAEASKLFSVQADYIPNDSEWEWLWTEWSDDFPEGKNWGVEAIDCINAWEFYQHISRSKTRVGVIDNMFDTAHEDLSYKRVWNNPSSITDKHGTRVSGTLAAKFNNNKGIAGVAEDAELYGFSILGSDTDPVL